MFKVEDKFERRTNTKQSRIIGLVEEARESLFDINQTIYTLTSNYKELFASGTPLTESLLRLNLVSQTTNQSLLKPRFILSTLGTTSSGKSTFVNGLLGKKLAPMDADELSAGTLRFNFNPDYKTKSRITITSSEKTKYWSNESIEDSNDNIYDLAFNIMNTYREESKKQTLPVPEINIDFAFLTGSKPQFLGLDNNAIIEILDLPGLRTISDSENLKVIQDNVRASFIIFILDYSKLFDIDNKKVLYEELREIKKSVGSDVTMIFVLNKVDLRNEDDKDLEIALSKTQNEIMENLNLKSLPDVVPFDSLLLYRINSAYLAYLNSGSLNDTENINIDFQEQIKSNLKICFKDCARQVSYLKAESDENWRLISEMDLNIFKGNTPTFANFMEFWKICSEKSGANKLFQKIRERTETSLKELILYPTLQKYLSESAKFLNLLNESIKTSSIRDEESIEKSRKNLDQIEQILKNTINSRKEQIKSRVLMDLAKVQSSSGQDRTIGLKSLGLNQVAGDVRDIIEIVDRDTIEAVKDFLLNEIRHDIVHDKLIQLFHWIPESVSELIDPYDYLRRKLYNEETSIKSGKTFEYMVSETSGEKQVKEISQKIEDLCKAIEKGIIFHIDLEMQRSINDLTIQVKNWIQKETSLIHDDLTKLIFDIDKSIELPAIKADELINAEYQGFLLGKKSLLETGKSEFAKTETIKTGTRIEQESITEKVEYEETTNERRWYTAWLYKHEKKVPAVKYVTKYVPKEVPIYEKQNKKVVQFASVGELTDKWQFSLYSLENDLWQDICETLIELFETALDSYERMILEVTEQINSILNQREIELKKIEKETDDKWNRIAAIYSEAVKKHSYLSSIVKTTQYEE